MEELWRRCRKVRYHLDHVLLIVMEVEGEFDADKAMTDRAWSALAYTVAWSRHHEIRRRDITAEGPEPLQAQE